MQNAWGKEHGSQDPGRGGKDKASEMETWAVFRRGTDGAPFNPFIFARKRGDVRKIPGDSPINFLLDVTPPKYID
jgi:hypothetical protein